MSYFLSALQDQDQKSDHGWSQANLFSQDSQTDLVTTESQTLAFMTPDSQSIASLDGWSAGGVVVEEVQNDLMNTSQYIFSNSSDDLQNFAEVYESSQVSNGNCDYEGANSNSSQPTTETVTDAIGSLSADKSFTSDVGQVLQPDTFISSDGPVTTFNVTVSPDGTLLHSATDDNVSTSDGYLYLNSNNALGISPSPATNEENNVLLSAQSAVTMATNQNGNIILAPFTTMAATTNIGNTATQNIITTVAMTTNHVSGGTVLLQNSVLPSPVKTSNVILIPKMSSGQSSILTLDNETVQKLISGQKQLFSSSKQFKFMAPSQANIIQTGDTQGTSNVSVTNKLSQSVQGYTIQPQSSTPKLTSLLQGCKPGPSLVKAVAVSQQNVQTVTLSQSQTSLQSPACNNSPGNPIKVQSQNLRTANNLLLTMNTCDKKQIITGGQSQNVGVVHGQYITTLTTNNGEILAKNVKGNSNIITGQNSQAVMVQDSSSSSPHNITYIITTSTPSKSEAAGTCMKSQGTITSSRGRGNNTRGRGRGRGAGSGGQYFVLKNENRTPQGKTVSVYTIKTNKGCGVTQTQKENSQNSSGSDIIDLITSPIKNSDCSTNTEQDQLNGKSIQSPGNENCINKKLVRCKDGGDLIAGTTYLVSGPNGLQKKMYFNGENFVEPPGEKSSPEGTTEGSMIGGGRTDKSRPLKGNATGLNMTRENNVSDSGKTLLPNGRPWKYTEPPHLSSLTRPPLHPTQPKDAEAESSQENSSQSSEACVGTEQRPEDKFSTEFMAVCSYCGMLSSNLTRCQGCFRIFPKDVKIKRASEVSRPSPVIDKSKFYSNKMSEQASGYGGYHVKHIEEKVISGRTVRNSGKQYKLVHTKKIFIPQEPVTVTISSDEDEPDTNEKPAQNSSVSSNTNDTTPASTPGNNEPDELSSLISVIPLKRSASPILNKGGRVSRMETEDGQPVRKVRRKSLSDGSNPIRMVSSKTAVIDSKSGTTEVATDDGSTNDLAMECRSIRVGSLKGTPNQPVIVSAQGVEVFMEGEDDSYTVKINSDDVVQCLFGKKCSIVVLQTTVESGVYIRQALGMHEFVEDKPYFDPGNTDAIYTYITFFLCDAYKLTLGQLKNVFKSYKHYTNPNFLTEMDYSDSQTFMVKTAPVITKKTTDAALQRIVKEDNQASENKKESKIKTPEPKDMERSPSPPRILFSGPIEKLITYPPPPATGGITVTNEDLFCLTDGEFLNDVIIDFYLKYLVHEKLSEADRKRTHVFSSFFFKLLTQRINRHSMDFNEAELSLPERRHARVKKWTKHVDLFEKDFIIVPINERSHWFLSIICFPGMTENRKIKYICKPVEEKTTNGEPVTDKGDNSSNPEKDTKETESQETVKLESQENKEEIKKDDEKIIKKEESPMEEDEEQDTKDEEEPMDTAETGSTNGNVPQEPRGRLLSEEELQDPEICKQAMDGIQQPCIIVMDSLAGQSRQRIINILKDYLQVEWNCKKSKVGSIREKFKGASPKVPQQTNYSDCGVYVLQYVDSFFEDPIFNFTFPMKSLTNWFTEERVSKKREEIKDLVMKLKEKFDSEKQKKS